MTDRQAPQTGNIVGGSQVGRDVNITHEREPSTRRTTMHTLTQRFRNEVQGDKNFRKVIDSLQYFIDPSVREESFDLEGKLSAAKRENDISEATALKELFSKKLARHQLSPAAQEIFAWILGHIQMSFRAHVRPLIALGETPEAVDKVVFEKVIRPAIEELEDNELILNYQELRGMLYYLTGNCHIEWHARA